MIGPDTVSVLVVDDSTVVRRLVTTALEGDPRIRVAGTAANGVLALAKLDLVSPDVVTLDIEMPVMDGLQTLREIRRRRPDLPVIMFSTLTERGAQATFEALSYGANDYVTKPTNSAAIRDSLLSVRADLVPRIVALHEAQLARRRPATRTRPPSGWTPSPPRPLAPPARSAQPVAQPAAPLPPAAAARATAPGRVEVVAIGCSTGGPEALAAVLAALPATLPVPVVVVQHMPPVFTKLFADRLERTCALTVHEAAGGETLRPGHVYIAPGDHHLEVVRSGTGAVTRLHQGPPENYCRPAVDVLFRSVAATFGGNVLAVVLTGMGSDGRKGVEPLAARGARVLVQDAETSVVWGMPGAVAGAGLADAVLPLSAIPAAITEALSGHRLPAAHAPQRVG